MAKRRKKILMACSNYWTSPFQVGSHHLARGFIDLGWDVAFISDPISPLHVIGGITSELKERALIYKSGGVSDLNGHIWAYVPGAIVTPHNKPLLRTDLVQKYWYRMTWPNVIKKIKQMGFEKVDIIYFDSVTQAFWLNILSHKHSIYRIADNNRGFVKSTQAMAKIEKWLGQHVDVVAYTALGLQEYVEAIEPRKMLYLPNGVNFAHFAYGDYAFPKEYKTISKPIAVYVGAMDVWFDYDLVNTVAEQLPDVSFVFIGPDKMAKTFLKPLRNIYLLGKRPYKELPAYLRYANIGIIPFNVKNYPQLVNNINPLKLYEYMAAGLPVVSAKWKELERNKTPAYLYENTEEFIHIFNSFDYKNIDSTLYIKYASKHNWKNKVGVLIDCL